MKLTKIEAYDMNAEVARKMIRALESRGYRAEAYLRSAPGFEGQLTHVATDAPGIVARAVCADTGWSHPVYRSPLMHEMFGEMPRVVEHVQAGPGEEYDFATRTP